MDLLEVMWLKVIAMMILKEVRISQKPLLPNICFSDISIFLHS